MSNSLPRSVLDFQWPTGDRLNQAGSVPVQCSETVHLAYSCDDIPSFANGRIWFPVAIQVCRADVEHARCFSENLKTVKRRCPVQ